MDTAKDADNNTMNELTAVAASHLRIDNETDKADGTDTATGLLFHLPRELRDDIYDRIALDEQKLFFDIILTSGERPQKTAYNNTGRVAGIAFPNSPVEVEYSAAVDRRIKSLLAGGDCNGVKLAQPGAPDFAPRPSQSKLTAEEIWLEIQRESWGVADSQRSKPLTVKSEEIWLEVSRGQHAGGQISHNVHALMLVVPMQLMPPGPGTVHSYAENMRLAPTVTFAFKFPEKAELGPRWRLDCHWDGEFGPDSRRRLHFPSDDDSSDDDSVLKQVLSVAKEMNWKGSVREYMLWQRYIVSNVSRNKQASEE